MSFLAAITEKPWLPQTTPIVSNSEIEQYKLKRQTALKFFLGVVAVIFFCEKCPDGFGYTSSPSSGTTILSARLALTSVESALTTESREQFVLSQHSIPITVETLQR